MLTALHAHKCERRALLVQGDLLHHPQAEAQPKPWPQVRAELLSRLAGSCVHVACSSCCFHCSCVVADPGRGEAPSLAWGLASFCRGPASSPNAKGMGTARAPSSLPCAQGCVLFKHMLGAYLRKQKQAKQPTSLHSWSLITHVAH